MDDAVPITLAYTMPPTVVANEHSEVENRQQQRSDIPYASSAHTSKEAGSDLDDSKSLATPAEPPPLASHPRQPSRLSDAFFGRKSSDFDLDSIATQPSVFDDPDFSNHYQPIKGWENRHRLDPSFRWTWREEKALVRKVDLRIALWAFVMFYALDLDRENIAQANSDGMLNDLGLSTADYNLGNTLFRVGFLFAELPSQMISKKIGVDIWIPTQLVIFSALSAAQFAMKGRASFLAFRWLIGMFQGGFIPDVVLFMSFFYTAQELPLRLAIFWTSNYVVKISSPFLALGILRLRGAGGHGGWQYLFLIEGAITLCIGLLSFVNMPAGPCQTRNWFYKKGWFSEREEKILVNRIIRNDPAKGGMHNRQGVDWKQFKKTLFDYDMYPLYLLGLTFMVSSYPLANYLTLELRSLGFSTPATNALTIPPPVVGLTFLVVFTWFTEVVDNRSFTCMIYQVWCFPFHLALAVIPKDSSVWTRYALSALQQAYPYVHPTQVAWVSGISGSVRTRTVASAVYNISVQVSSIIGANVYQPSDKPLYRKGNLAMAILSVACLGQYLAIYFYYRWRNRSKAKVWDAMTKEQKIEYLEKNPEASNKRLDFRFQT